MTLVWIDLETTGFDPDIDAVLEVACIITDDAFNEIARFHRVLRFHDEINPDIYNIAPVVVEMHAKNGLWRDCAASGVSRAEVDRELQDFIADNCDANCRQSPQLAGSTISFDRAFLKHHLPSAHAMLHYRNFDVTTLNELARRIWPALYEGRPVRKEAHRAMSDIEESIEVARYYVERLTVKEQS